MEEKKICACCNAENEQNAEFCASCGSVLTGVVTPETSAEQPEQTNDYIPNENNFTPPPVNMPNMPFGDYHTEEGEVVSAAEMNRFVGKNADKILKKFTVMEVTGNKTSWNWPVFFLTLFCGLIGTSFWFFYRKMNKIGAILLSIGMALSLIFSFASGELKANAELNKTIIESVGEIQSIDDILGAANEFTDVVTEETAGSIVVDGIVNTVDIACAIVFALFSYHLYKKHCLTTIVKIRRSAANEVASFTMYNQLGGVSSGAVWVAILINMFALSALEEILTVLIYGI